MNFLGQTVVIIAMALISASLSGVAYILFGFKLETAILMATGLFAAQVIFQLAAWRIRDRVKTTRDLHDLGRALESVTRDISVLNNKMSAIDHSGVMRSVQDVAALKGAMQNMYVEMEQVGITLQQHYDLIQSARNPVPFGQKKRIDYDTEHAHATDTFSPAHATQLGSDHSHDTVNAIPQRRGPLSHLDMQSAAEIVRATIDQGRIEIMLQPIVTLPQRKIRWYEILSRLRLEGGETLLPEDFLPLLSKADTAMTFDTMVLYRAVQLVRRMQTRNKDIGVVINICPATLNGGMEFENLVDFLSANSALADSLIIEISQAGYATLGPMEFESMAAIAKLGFRFSLDQARDLRLDAKGLADRNFKTVKVPGEILLGRAVDGSSDIHPADLSDLLTRYGITLIADRIESESMVIDLLDYDVGYAQGFLFAPPRPVKADVLDDLPMADGVAKSALAG